MSNGRLSSYVTAALERLEDKGMDTVLLKAMGRAINKTVALGESTSVCRVSTGMGVCCMRPNVHVLHTALCSCLGLCCTAQIPTMRLVWVAPLVWRHHGPLCVHCCVIMSHRGHTQ
jgi:hypothetical protein